MRPKLFISIAKCLAKTVDQLCCFITYHPVVDEECPRDPLNDGIESEPVTVPSTHGPSGEDRNTDAQVVGQCMGILLCELQSEAMFWYPRN